MYVNSGLLLTLGLLETWLISCIYNIDTVYVDLRRKTEAEREKQRELKVIVNLPCIKLLHVQHFIYLILFKLHDSPMNGFMTTILHMRQIKP